MRYKEVEGSPEELISHELDEIERKEKVKILHAVESGSRSWGFASPDSDYDVRFLYVRQKSCYLELRERGGVINWKLDETLDINGWDLKKALLLFYKSNATLFEWAQSPVVYRTTGEWSEIYRTARLYFSAKACLYHYYGTANSNYRRFFREGSVKYKKYFYVLRPLLACKWIEEHACPPPVLFDTLLEQTAEAEVKAPIEELLEVKKTMNEADQGRRIDVLDRYIEDRLVRYKKLAGEMSDDRRPDIGELDRVFMEHLL